MIQLLK